MSKQRVYLGAFPVDALFNLNPTLKTGECIFITENGVVTNFKVGPGVWNDLDYQLDNKYNYSEIVSNPIGDAEGNLVGLDIQDILRKMLNPYIPVEISNVLNNADSTFDADSTFEIGQSVNTFDIQYTINNIPNLADVTPINLNASGLFNEEGDQVYNSGVISVTAISPLSPTVPTVYTINVTATGDNAEESTSSTTITFKPKLIWGVAQTTTITESGLINIADKQVLITDTFNRDYQFNITGYLYIAIPTMLSPSSLSFIDKLTSLPVEFINQGALSLNNGVGTYSYTIYRSTYLITQSSNNITIL